MTRSRKSFNRPRVVLLAGLAGLGAVVAAAGQASLNPNGPWVQVARIGSEPPAPVVDPHDDRAVQISLERTRGGNDIAMFQVSAFGEHSKELLELVSGPEFRALGPRYAPASKKDRFRYEVTVRYRDGDKKKVVTYSDTPGTPQVLLDVIDKTESIPMPVFPAGFPFN
ncbi:hypothetical protein [Actinoplanes sp. G11-F43]|uniref:hypothetical protein n=1 Tax=Actinoplanes sp. G11-F43 TaxID=3424130 RepID=UPI003D3429A0